MSEITQGSVKMQCAENTNCHLGQTSFHGHTFSLKDRSSLQKLGGGK